MFLVHTENYITAQLDLWLLRRNIDLVSSINRSSCSQMFFKIDVLKYFFNIHRKARALESLFNKVAGLT